MRVLLALLVFLLAACRHPAYTLRDQGRAQLLTPPPSKPEIKHARSHPARKEGCDVESAAFSVTWHGDTARVSAKDETYFAPPAGQVKQPGTAGITIAESGPRIFMDPLANIQKFREALAATEDAGCLRAEEAPLLRQRITEAFPFPPNIAVYLRFGAYTQTSYFDLTPEFLLRLVSPPVTHPDISFYAVVAVPKTDRMKIVLLSGVGKTLTIPDKPGYFRYLYATGAADHNFRATLLGAPDRGALRDATQQFLAAPEQFCAKPAAGVFCQSVDRTVGINAGFNVRINGKESFVRLGGSIGEAITDEQSGFHAIGRTRARPNVKSVRRLFHGKPVPIKFDPASTAILGMAAMPGDEIVEAAPKDVK